MPGARIGTARTVAVAAATALLALSVAVFLRFDVPAGGLQLAERYPWLSPLGVTLHLAVDGLAAPMVLLTGVVFFCGVLVSLSKAERVKDYFILLLVLVGGVFGTFLSVDLFFFFFFYEVAVLPMYLLIGVWGSSSDFGSFVRTKEYGAMKLMLMLVAASVPIWVVLIATFLTAGGRTFDLLDLQDIRFARDFQMAAFPLLMVGFGVLAGLWPFHTWSPDGHVAAPTAVSMLHAGVLMKLGAFGLLRVAMPLFPEGAHAWMPVLVALGSANVLYGAVSALGQRDLKYVIGYSSVSHMGYVLLGLAALSSVGVAGAVLQMFSHGIMTALFFALVGVVYDQAHTREIAVFGGLAKRTRLVAVFFAIAGFTSLGLPGFSGFVAEFLVFAGLFERYPVFGALAVVGAAITAVYILRLVATVFFGELSERWSGLRDAGRVDAAALTVLAAFLILVGVFPGLLLGAINQGVEPLMARLLQGL